MLTAQLNTYSSPPNSELLRKYGHVDVFPMDDSQLSLLDPEDIGGWQFGNPGDEVTIEGSVVIDTMLDRGLISSAEANKRIDAWLEDGQEE
jgi:SET domain-containing protein 6